MKKSLILGMALASFSFSSLAQNSETNGVPTSALEAIKAQLYGENDDTSDTLDTASFIANPNNGVGNGAPDMSAFQAKAIASAQNLSKPVDVRQAPEGAADILKQGAGALQATNVNQFQNLSQDPSNKNLIPQEFLTPMSNFNTSNNSNLIKITEKPKADIFLTDISSWNKNTLQQFEKEGRERTEKRYQEFLSK